VLRKSEDPRFSYRILWEEVILKNFDTLSESQHSKLPERIRNLDSVDLYGKSTFGDWVNGTKINIRADGFYWAISLWLFDVSELFQDFGYSRLERNELYASLYRFMNPQGLLAELDSELVFSGTYVGESGSDPELSTYTLQVERTIEHKAYEVTLAENSPRKTTTTYIGGAVFSEQESTIFLLRNVISEETRILIVSVVDLAFYQNEKIKYFSCLDLQYAESIEPEILVLGSIKSLIDDLSSRPEYINNSLKFIEEQQTHLQN
jgi:hypothetical protein